MGKIRIGTRESQLAVWQASQVQNLLAQNNFDSELVFIKSEGDIDLVTPLYELGVQGIFTRSLDAALINKNIDIAVHSLKDVPTKLPGGIIQASVLKRGPVNDLVVFKNDEAISSYKNNAGKLVAFNVATSSIRRKAQWLHQFPRHTIHNLRGNVNTRLRKLQEESWDAAIFAQAGLERINLRPQNSLVLDWMLPAPAQGAMVVVCRENDDVVFDACHRFNDLETELCTSIEREFLRRLLGGCSTPISALAKIENEQLHFRGNILSMDGREKIDIEKTVGLTESDGLGIKAAEELLLKGGEEIARDIRHAT